MLGTKYQMVGGVGALLAVVLLSFSTFHYMVIFWSFFAGVGLSMLYLRPGYEVPNLLDGSYPKQTAHKRDGNLSGCTVCGKRDCKRERRQASLEALRPWSGIFVTDREDRAVQDFLETLLEKHVWKWYRNLSKEEEFINELKISLRHVVSVLYRRINKIDLPEVITKKLLRIAIEHLHVCLCAMDRGKCSQDDILTYYGPRLHTAARSRRQELNYIRGLCQVILPLILPQQFMEGDIMKSFLRELLSSNVILPGLDAITDPPEVATEPPAPKVPFLEKFAPPEIMQNDSAVELPEILQSQDMLYPFMTFLKAQGAVNILQFCLTVEDFNRRCLAPEQTTEQKQKLHKEAKDIYETYCLPDSTNFIHFDEDVTKDLGDIAKGSWKDVNSLQTSTPMFKAYEHAFNLLEQVYCPLFYHSDIFYKMVCGDRTGPVTNAEIERDTQKQTLERSVPAKLGNRIMGVLKGSDTGSLNGDNYSDMDETETEDTDRTSLIDSEDDSNGRQDVLRTRDLSTWRVSVEKVTQQEEDGGDRFYAYVIAINRLNLQEDDELPPQWSVLRRYSEFYVLESKLCEFHGSLSPAHLPPKKLFGRPLEFLNSKCIEFERFLQALISKRVLRRSKLLYDFLSPDDSGVPSQFGSRFLPEVKLGRFFKRVPTKIIKEKGQHLDKLLQSLINSCEPSKPKPGKYESPVEDPVVQMDQKLHNDLYRDGDWQMDPSEFSLTRTGSKPQLPLNGISDYVLYLSKRVFQVENWCFHILVALRTVLRNTAEPWVHNLMQKKIDTYREEHHVVNLINTFKDLLFNPSTPRTDKEKLERRETTLKELMDFVPKHFAKFIGKKKHKDGCKKLHDLVQMPKLNKQLGYLLLDAFLLELFPELVENSTPYKT